MHVLIIAATEDEIAPLLRDLGAKWADNNTMSYKRGELQVDILISGVGMVRTAYALGKAFTHRKPDLCINAGIAGAFEGKFQVGEVVHVTQDTFSEMGATDQAGDFIDLSEMGLHEDIANPDLNNYAAARFDFLPKAKGITVNTVHGDPQSIMQMQRRYDPDVETMESAAVFYACIKEDVSFLCLRAISNIVKPRDKSEWDIPAAVIALNQQLSEILLLLSV